MEIRNFGPYKGVFEFDFAQKDKKNIDIIWGKNGSGKTSILKAIKWCLYGYDTSPKDKEPRQATRKDAWDCIYGTNKENQIPPDPFMHVYIWFEDTAGTETTSYLLKRTVVPRNQVALNSNQIDIHLSLFANGKEEIINQKEKIESILPIAACQFFMFHGEDLRYMSQEHLEHTKKAIELILEAETFRAGIRDLTRITKDIEKEHDEELAKIESLATLVNSKDHFTKRIEIAEHDLSSCQKDLEVTRKRIEVVEEELRTRERSKASMARLDDLRKQKSQLEDNEKKLLSRRDSLVNKLPAFVILPELIKVLDKKQESHKKREEVNQTILQLQGRLGLAEEISKLQECICGHEITGVEKNFIEAQRQTFGRQIAELKVGLVDEDPTYFQLRETIKGLRSSDPDFETLQKDIADLRRLKDEADSAIENVERQLSGIDEDKIRALTEERNDLARAEGEILERKRNIENSKKEAEAQKERCVKLIQQRERAYSLSSSLDEQYNLSRKCLDSFGFVLSQLSILRKSQIMEYSTRFFTKLTNKPEEYTRMDIDDDYNVRIVDSKGNIIYRPGLSTAEREIVALSFILGLKNASEKIAPLVLDTFFVHLDESHYSNIVRELPSFSSQTILVLTDLEYKNLKERAPESFFDSVNHICKINRIQADERSEPLCTKEAAIIE
jgi:DNA sulfur modification protein DndD